MREPIFYGGESAYAFQYREFVVAKYKQDNQWLRTEKGFSIEEARDVVRAFGDVYQQKGLELLKKIRASKMGEQANIPRALAVDPLEIATRSGIQLAVVEAVLGAFSVPAGFRNELFVSLGAYNAVAAYPLIPLPGGGYYLYCIYAFVESLYESPCYWMSSDRGYVATAMVNRGKFTEQFAIQALMRVFGPSKVLGNVEIYRKGGKEKLGEIDALVVFGDRLLLLQAKSKRLTLEARRGNDRQLNRDFKEAVQDSYGQALACAQLLLRGDCELKTPEGDVVEVPMSNEVGRVYLLCLVSDHFPALSLQTKTFLKRAHHDRISDPFVMDVFALDVVCEMLDTPLGLLSYIDRRTEYFDRVMAGHELNVLGYHLKNNLWLESELDFVLIDDDMSVELDAAMLVRRDGLSGSATPEGVLTRLKGGAVGRLLAQIEASPDAASLGLGFVLLRLGEDSVRLLGHAIDGIAAQASADGAGHDVTVVFEELSSGLTIHCNSQSQELALRSLDRHMLARKYTQRASTWFGVCLDPGTQKLRFVCSHRFPHQSNSSMDSIVAGLPRSSTSLARAVAAMYTRPAGRDRNAPCACGSGRKRKKCCDR